MGPPAAAAELPRLVSLLSQDAQRFAAEQNESGSAILRILAGRIRWIEVTAGQPTQRARDGALLGGRAPAG